MTLADARLALAALIAGDPEIQARRARLVQRRAEDAARARHAAFWRDVALKAAADAAIQRAQGRG